MRLIIASSISSPPDSSDWLDDDPAERDHGDLGRTAADVDDHVPGRLGDGQPCADRGGHRLLDEVRLPGAGRERRLLDGALLDARDARRDADDDPRVREAVLVDLLDEVAHCSLTSKSATSMPSFSGRIAEIEPGVRPNIRFASTPTAWTSPVRWSIATTDGSERTIPRPRT